MARNVQITVKEDSGEELLITPYALRAWHAGGVGGWLEDRYLHWYFPSQFEPYPFPSDYQWHTSHNLDDRFERAPLNNLGWSIYLCLEKRNAPERVMKGFKKAFQSINTPLRIVDSIWWFFVVQIHYIWTWWILRRIAVATRAFEHTRWDWRKLFDSLYTYYNIFAFLRIYRVHLNLVNPVYCVSLCPVRISFHDQLVVSDPLGYTHDYYLTPSNKYLKLRFQEWVAETKALPDQPDPHGFIAADKKKLRTYESWLSSLGPGIELEYIGEFDT